MQIVFCNQYLNMNKLKRILLSFFEFVSYYKLDLSEQPEYTTKRLKEFKFKILNESDLKSLTHFAQSRGESYINISKERLINKENFICYAFIENHSNEIAYTRWVCKNEFYSEPLKRMLKFKTNEVLTLDSYTKPDFRGKGLHKEMNVVMLNHLKNQLQIDYVYMVIKWFFPYLVRIVEDLGYRKIESKIYYKKGSLNKYFRIIREKLI